MQRVLLLSTIFVVALVLYAFAGFPGLYVSKKDTALSALEQIAALQSMPSAAQIRRTVKSDSLPDDFADSQLYFSQSQQSPWSGLSANRLGTIDLYAGNVAITESDIRKHFKVKSPTADGLGSLSPEKTLIAELPNCNVSFAFEQNSEPHNLASVEIMWKTKPAS